MGYKTKEFVDEKGNKSEIFITSTNDGVVHLGQNYKLQRPKSDNIYLKKGAKASGVFTSDIGIKSQGFAPIFTLALIITLATIIVVYLLWRL